MKRLKNNASIYFLSYFHFPSFPILPSFLVICTIPFVVGKPQISMLYSWQKKNEFYGLNSLEIEKERAATESSLAKKNLPQESIALPKDDQSVKENDEEESFILSSKVHEKKETEKGFSQRGSSLERQFHYQCHSEKSFHYQVLHQWHVIFFSNIQTRTIDISCIDLFCFLHHMTYSEL